MRFVFAVEIEVKNDGATQESEPGELAVMLLETLQDNPVHLLPWVINQHYEYVGKVT